MVYLYQWSKEGPFSILALMRDERLTPDTLVWKAGFEKWMKIREVAELKDLFRDPKGSSSDGDQDNLEPLSKRDDSVLALSYDPFHFWFWLLVGALLILYMFHRMGWFDL